MYTCYFVCPSCVMAITQLCDGCSIVVCQLLRSSVTTDTEDGYEDMLEKD